MREFTCRVTALTKRFGAVVAVNDVSFTLSHGEIFCLVGPNGAGKTTTIKCILGIIRPDKGQIELLGEKMPHRRKKILRQLGYLPQTRALYSTLTVRENLWFFGKIKDMDGKILKKRIDEILERLKLTEHADKLIMHCSGGTQQRTALGAAVIHEPEFLVLDEPTVGLDPVLRTEFWKYFRDLVREKNITVLLTTHYLQESEYADRVSIMRNGTLIVIDSPSALKKRYSSVTMEEVFLNAIK